MLAVFHSITEKQRALRIVSKHGTGEQVNRMDDLIRRQDAIDACFDTRIANNYDIADLIEMLPSAERKGKWIEASEDWRNQITWWQCSECGTPSSIKSNFCPNCGSHNGGNSDE